MIDPTTLTGPVGGMGSLSRATADWVPPAWAEQYFRRTAARFPESRARITFAADVRHERIVVPIPDALLTDDEIDFVSYIDPSRTRIEDGWKQSLAEHPPIIERPPISGSDTDEKAADMIETVAEALRQTIVNWDGLIGKGVEDGELGLVIQYDLEDFLSYPLPSEVLTTKAYQKLAKAEQETFVEVDQGQGRVTYRRYRPRYWRDKDGRRPSDAYYRGLDDDGEPRTFERDDLATRRAWREHAKTWRAGQIPLTVRMVSATNCAPLLIAGTGSERWECRGLAIREWYALDDLVAQGYAWTGLGTPLYPIGFDSATSGRSVPVYQVHCWLEGEDDDGSVSLHPCVVTCVDGRATERLGPDGAYEPAIVDLKREYGLDVLPANYIHFAHTDADEPDDYGRPAMYSLLSAILNREGTLTAYQTHLRKYALGKLAVTIDPQVPKETYLNADNTMKDLDTSADIVMLPGPVGPLAQPPAPNAVRDLLLIYSNDLQQNAPGEQTRGAGDSSASGHSLQLQQGYFLAANRAIMEAGRKATEWIVSTALRMLVALEERYKVKVSVFVREKPPANAQAARKRGQAIEIDSRWFKDNFTLVAKYPHIGNLAEIQQVADLADRGFASFEDVMEARGKTSPFNERVAIATDTWWKTTGQQLLMIQAMKLRGDAERAAILEAQASGEMQPGGLPTAAVPPELMMLQQQMGQQPHGPMPGVQMPNMAASMVGGQVAGAIGAGAQMNDAQALAAAGLPGGGV